MRKFIAIALALVMLYSLAVPVMAGPRTRITEYTVDVVVRDGGLWLDIMCVRGKGNDGGHIFVDDVRITTEMFRVTGKVGDVHSISLYLRAAVPGETASFKIEYCQSRTLQNNKRTVHFVEYRTVTVPTGSDTVADLTACADTYIVRGSANQNNGISPTLYNASNNRILVDFDLTGIPADAVIKKAELQMNAITVGTGWGNSGKNYYAYKVADEWAEGDGCRHDEKDYCSHPTTSLLGTYGVTWSNYSYPGYVTESDPPSRKVQNGDTNSLFSWDVTDHVQGFVNGDDNFGWIFIPEDDDKNAGVAGNATFWSKEGSADLAPRLVIIYE